MITIWELIIQFGMRAPPVVVTVFTAKISDVICRFRRGRRGFGYLFFTYIAPDVFVMPFGGMRYIHDLSPCLGPPLRAYDYSSDETKFASRYTRHPRISFLRKTVSV